MALAITKAPYRHFHTLLGGIIALEDELSWFQVIWWGIVCWASWIGGGRKDESHWIT